MLAVFVSLRDFTLQLGCPPRHSGEYLRYITKASHRAPHLQSFTIDHYYTHTFRFKWVNGNWVVCDEAEYPAT